MKLVYMGFSQAANVRNYRFQGILPKERAQEPAHVDFSLRADMAMLTTCHIPIQDGPALCLQILSDGLARTGDAAVSYASYDITRQDLSVYESARTAIEESKAARRKFKPAVKPSAASQLRWP